MTDERPERVRERERWVMVANKKMEETETISILIKPFRAN